MEEEGRGGQQQPQPSTNEEEEELKAFNVGPPQTGGKRVRHHGISMNLSRGE